MSDEASKEICLPSQFLTSNVLTKQWPGMY